MNDSILSIFQDFFNTKTFPGENYYRDWFPNQKIYTTFNGFAIILQHLFFDQRRFLPFLHKYYNSYPTLFSLANYPNCSIFRMIPMKQIDGIYWMTICLDFRGRKSLISAVLGLQITNSWECLKKTSPTITISQIFSLWNDGGHEARLELAEELNPQRLSENPPHLSV